MEMVKKRPKNQNAAKWNWEPVFGDLDAGMPWREVARKYSMPEKVVYEKARIRRKELAAGFRELALLDKGKPAASRFPVQVVKPIVENALSISQAPDPSELSEDQLVTVLSDPAAILALDPAAAEKLFGRQLQKLVAEGLATMRAPACPKELGPMAKLFREFNGLTADKAKGGNGLLSPPRAFGRRMVREAIEVGGVVESEIEPDGGWPEGM